MLLFKVVNGYWPEIKRIWVTQTPPPLNGADCVYSRKYPYAVNLYKYLSRYKNTSVKPSCGTLQA